MGRDQTGRLMRSQGLRGVKGSKRVFTTKSDPAGKRPTDLVQRHFRADAPRRLWVVDATYARLHLGRIPALVASLGMRSSMGPTGVCWDNSMAESFFSMLKNERVYRTVYATKTQARRDVIRYIEGFYDSPRRHSGLGYRRPNEVHYGCQQPALAA